MAVPSYLSSAAKTQKWQQRRRHIQIGSNVPDEAECEELLAWGEIWAGAEWTCLAWCLSTLIWSSLVILSIVDSRF